MRTVAEIARELREAIGRPITVEELAAALRSEPDYEPLDKFAGRAHGPGGVAHNKPGDN